MGQSETVPNAGTQNRLLHYPIEEKRKEKNKKSSSNGRMKPAVISGDGLMWAIPLVGGSPTPDPTQLQHPISIFTNSITVSELRVEQFSVLGGLTWKLPVDRRGIATLVEMKKLEMETGVCE